MLIDNLKIVQENIQNSVQKCNRNLNELRIVAVSKMNPVERIIEAYNAGLFDFGENKALELRDKSEIINQDVIWHFIGHLQTNKVKNIIEKVDFIHSVENFKLAVEINKQAKKANKTQNIFFEVNTSGESAKYGLKNYDELSELASKCEELQNINPIGLMTMAQFTNDENIIRNSFSQLREFRDKISNKYFLIKELSMGMTNDYKIAIEEGATMLRIGAAIFGNSDYSLSWSKK
ncbi:MAG: YggS family pyridoxal phosphate-dependent enzyme [Bacteroidetes bacterium]|nr:YggS family pyridoxal phosphate-dependent enzyme [Bacteroidota bacterium]MBU1113651.1 YggS family pyridoxal phosphate-dependent enzyme [Bacteroidota bacterium]MBU1796773.1 YggS family pyridoxal phosphate-dependent enzyme [Bacteroidota bacterium]